jgi:hypothetical protein
VETSPAPKVRFPVGVHEDLGVRLPKKGNEKLRSTGASGVVAELEGGCVRHGAAGSGGALFGAVGGEDQRLAGEIERLAGDRRLCKRAPVPL